MGRYSLTKRRKDVEKELAARLRVRLHGEEGFERFNIAPTQEVLAVVQNRDGRRARLLRWGLVPFWAKQVNTGLTMINARAETIAGSSTYGGLVERGSHRCLVVADGFYEWLKAEDPRQPRRPLRFSLAGGASFSFAGLWTTWRGAEDEPVASCTIVTTACPWCSLTPHRGRPGWTLPSTPAASHRCWRRWPPSGWRLPRRTRP